MSEGYYIVTCTGSGVVDAAPGASGIYEGGTSVRGTATDDALNHLYIFKTICIHDV